ncbi:MAG: hypothetical protein ABSB67_05645 [Bryobacteraceae bacterium]|jgi:hypothetical protein
MAAIAPAIDVVRFRYRRVALPGFVREPLVHFFILGALLFVAGRMLQKPARAPARTRIDVPAAEVRRMREVWTLQWHRPPQPAELQSLIDEYVREQVLFREALAMGLDRDDEIVRRRLVQKMQFLSQEMKHGADSSAEPAGEVD